MQLEKTLRLIENTPFTSWKRLDYSAPDLLKDLYCSLSEFFLSLLEEALNKYKTDNKIISGYHNWIMEKKVEETPFEYVKEHFYAAGGYVSDYIISEIHQTPFVPRDVDFFVDASFIERILDILAKSSPKKLKETDNSNEEKDNYFIPFGVNMEGYETPKYEDIWELLGNRLKGIFIDCNWENNNLSGSYSFSQINVIYRFTFKGMPIELIIGNDNRILNFDLSFRCAYYINHSFYINELGLKDIHNKVIRSFHQETPISTLIRMFDFKRRFEFEIDNFSLMLLLFRFNISEIYEENFFDKLRNHKKYTKEIENAILSIPHKVETKISRSKWIVSSDPHSPSSPKDIKDVEETHNILKFDLHCFSEYNPNLDRLYIKCCDLLESKGQIFYSKIETYLKNISVLNITYERPKDWFTDQIFIKGVNYQKTFNDWLSFEKLTAMFDPERVNRHMHSYQLTTDTLYLIEEMIYNRFNNIEIDPFNPEHVSALFNLPLIARSDKFSIEISDVYDLIFRDQIDLTISDPIFSNEIYLKFDTKNKTLKFHKLSSDTYFGFTKYTYKNFVEQIKTKLGFEDYTLEQFSNDEDLSNYFDEKVNYITFEVNPVSLMKSA